mmetsp:Transcript_31298/g.99863  ORF Transcript_31298/g.99863 Transcript_31298/m.99863 type:complete len:908 (+) Transcript_31298:128-2851(+)
MSDSSGGSWNAFVAGGMIGSVCAAGVALAASYWYTQSAMSKATEAFNRAAEDLEGSKHGRRVRVRNFADWGFPSPSGKQRTRRKDKGRAMSGELGQQGGALSPDKVRKSMDVDLDAIPIAGGSPTHSPDREVLSSSLPSRTASRQLSYNQRGHSIEGVAQAAHVGALSPTNGLFINGIATDLETDDETTLNGPGSATQWEDENDPGMSELESDIGAAGGHGIGGGKGGMKHTRSTQHMPAATASDRANAALRIPTPKLDPSRPQPSSMFKEKELPPPHAPPSTSGSELDGDHSYSHIFAPEDAPLHPEDQEVCAMLLEMIELRTKYLYVEAENPWEKAPKEVAVPSQIQPDPFKWIPAEGTDHEFEMKDGVVHVYAKGDRSTPVFAPPDTADGFFRDMHRVLKVSSMGPVKTFTHRRLMLLEQRFNLHLMLNADHEFIEQKQAPHRDFYNVRKVDTHVHHSACMNQKHLLRFIKAKLKKEPNEIVIFRDGKYLTLKEVFESLGMTGYDLNIDTMDMHADKNTFHRFDRFNLKYNPCGQSRLREIFMKQENLIHGRYLGELTKEVFSDLESSKYQMAEYRISIYGRKMVEWDTLAAWICNNKLYSDNVVWLIQIPRLFNIYKSTGVVENFQEMLDNIFIPLFEVTVDPNSHPQLHLYLQQVVGFDMVDDESKPERRPNKHMKTPAQWDVEHNPAYSYYAYYVYANLFVLNKLRESKGMNVFRFRPHSGEAGDLDHLVSTFMISENIAHGNNLRKSPCMQYLFYLSQIGLAMSPLSNNSLFIDYHRNPFPMFFARGLNVSLSTDDPLQIHMTKEPLVEEYSIAAQVWKLSSCDLCEIARNGVMQSGFPWETKMHWVSADCHKPGPEGNDIHKTNVPDLRLKFRNDTHRSEINILRKGQQAAYVAAGVGR